MKEQNNDFFTSLKEGVSNKSEAIKKHKIMQLIDKHPEILDELTYEQLMVVEKYYSENLKKVKNNNY